MSKNMHLETFDTIGDWYHVYNRGANKTTTFHDERDYQRFIKLLFLSNSTQSFQFRDFQEKSLGEIERGETLVDIAAYVLMPNHFHVLLKEKVPGAKETFLRKLCTGYTMYYNKKYQHTGVVFQGACKSKLIESDQYFQYLALYIHLNPVKLIEPEWKTKMQLDVNKITKYLDEYTYSSYFDFGKYSREEALILSDALGDVKKYFDVEPQKMLERWIDTREIYLGVTSVLR